MQTTLFKFIGDYPEAKNVKSFVVEVTPDEFARISQFPYPPKMESTVIESKNPARKVGESTHLVNPYYEMHMSGFPCFIRIRR